MLSTRLTRWLRPALPFIAALLLGACNTVTRAPDPIKDAPRADAATVIVSITANTTLVRGFNNLIVQQVTPSGAQKAGEQHALNQIAPGLSRDTALFVGMLPEGEYEFAHFSDTTSNRRIDLGAGSRELIGRFKVARGQTVDLGRLVLTPVSVKVVIGRSVKITSNKPLIDRYAPEYATLFKNGTVAGWSGPRHADDNVEAFALSRPVGFDHPVEADDGTLLGASRLGSVILRTPKAQWRAVRSPGLESLLDVMPVKTNDAVLLAVGEFNTLLRLPPGGHDFVPMNTGNLPAGNLVFIAGDEIHGWYVAQQRKDELTIYRSLFLENGDWQPVRKESVGFSFWSGQDMFWPWRRADGFSYATSDGKLNHLDYASGQWRSMTAPKERHISNIVANPDGSLGILVPGGSGLAGMFAELYLSQDQGKTWTEVKPKNSVRESPPMRLRSGTMLVRSIEMLTNVELNASKDGGQTWLPRKERTRGTLTALPSGRLVSVETGSIFSVNLSTDEGDTWRTGYTDFDMPSEASAKK